MGIGWKEILMILLVVLLVFGTKKLKTIGSDLGAAVKGFKKAVNDEPEPPAGRLTPPPGGEKDADFGDSAPNASRSGSKNSTGGQG